MAITDRTHPIPVPGGQVPPAQAPARQLPPPIAAGIIALCVLAFLGQGYLTTEVPGAGQVPLGVLFGPLVQEGQWWRAFTTIFTHGGVLHLLLNMSVVYSLGFPLERSLGSARFGLVSLVTALGASSTVLLLAWDKPTVGASGMILGWAGVMLPVVTRQERSNLLTWLAQIAVISFLPGVSWQGHLGGFVWGLFCGLALKAGKQVFWLAAPLLAAAAFGLVVYGANHPLQLGG